ncbi:MAG: glycosyltransferase, partial [Cyanobacteria bacterium K_DeepCast_0m_m1_088]|nr:glycosyltransferase [Cyanobacteria bacterium K_DeepCast_0m_m1_088]
MVILAAVSVLSWCSVVALLLLLLALELQLGRAPRLELSASQVWPEAISAVRVVIPVFNEEENIGECLDALGAALPPDLPVAVLVADDESTDGTVALAQSSSSVQVVSAGPRPAVERWCGKNWPASVAAAMPWPDGDSEQQWLLFLDADVKLRPGAIAAALSEASRSGADLLSLAPRLECGCLAEWLVQPIV